MNKNTAKPSPEAKALSLFLMAHKSESPTYKEKLKRINKQWDLLGINEISEEDYSGEVLEMLKSYGGYTEVIWKTVKFYINKTGEWSLKGDDKYCQDAKEIADKILNK